jgi:hypothetical protein
VRHPHGGGPPAELAEWKSQQMRDEYARQAAQLQIGDRCEIGGHKGELAFLGDGIEGLPGGFWVGIRYISPSARCD